MADANENPSQENPPPDAGASSDVVSRVEFRKVVDQRQAARAERQALADKVASYEADHKEREDAKLLEEKNFEEFRSRMDKEKAELLAEIDKRDAADAALEKEKRRKSFLDEVHKQSKLSGSHRMRLDGLLGVMERDGFDTAPEDIDAKHVKKALERMQALDTDTFKSKTMGTQGSPGVPKDAEPDLAADTRRKRVRDLAKGLSSRRSPDGAQA